MDNKIVSQLTGATAVGGLLVIPVVKYIEGAPITFTEAETGIMIAGAGAVVAFLAGLVRHWLGIEKGA